MADFTPKLVQRSLKVSIFDGSAFSAMVGLTQDYMVPFALALRATTAQVGLLSSIPNLAMALSQLAAPRLVQWVGNRKGLILPAVFMQALMWLPILLVPYLFPAGKVWWLIAFFTFGTVFGTIGNPAWGSMMADLVPPWMRGKYFGFRGRITGLVTLAFFFIGGTLLHFADADVFSGFAIIFGGAALFRMLSWYFLTRMYEPPLAQDNTPKLRPRSTLKDLRSTSLGRFTMTVPLFNFATYMASPFFAVYMLRDLGFSYLNYVVVTSAATVATLTFLTFWGRRTDIAGNIKVIKVTSLLIPLIPLAWLVSHQVYYLIAAQVLSGFAWSGFNLATTNFLYDASASKDRTRDIALFNAINGSCICLGALFGGFIASRLPPLLGYQLLSLFLVSGIARAVVAITLLSHISEVRLVPKTNTLELLLGIKTQKSIVLSGSSSGK
ncbi:MAG: MFS transporter [Chloroflexi bacterium]|nr:MFS transporter [Chloroflexota bacterium]